MYKDIVQHYVNEKQDIDVTNYVCPLCDGKHGYNAWCQATNDSFIMEDAS